MSNEYEYRKSNWPAKMDAKIFTDLMSGVKVLPRIDTIGLTSFPSSCFVPKRINFVWSWSPEFLSGFLRNCINCVHNCMRGSFLTWNFVLSGFISNWWWESHSTTRWRSWKTLDNARSVSQFKGKKQLSIVYVRFNFAIWDDIRQVIEVKGKQ